MSSDHVRARLTRQIILQLESDFMILLGQLENIAGPEINYTKVCFTEFRAPAALRHYDSLYMLFSVGQQKVATPRKMYAELSRLLEEYMRGVDSA